MRIGGASVKALGTVGTAVLLALFATDAIAADSLLHYEHRVKLAIEQVERIQKDPDYADDGIDSVKELMPGREEIDAGGQQVLVDNTWLHLLLYSYQRDKDSREAARKLTEARGRLEALHDHLVYLENESDGASLAQRRAQLNGILSDPEFARNKESSLAKFIREEREKIVRFIERILNSLFSRVFGPAGESGWLFKGLILLILAVALGFVGWTLLKVKRKPKKRKTITILGEDVEEGTSSSDLAGAALGAAKAGEFRTAVRKLYIALLYGLAEKNVIELETNQTNHEYLREVARHPSLAPPVRHMTDRFDYFWYGMFPVSKEEFEAYFSRYNEAVRNLQAFGAAGAVARSNPT